jgi:hypothetical protein
LLALGFVEDVTVNANSSVYISLPPKTGTNMNSIVITNNTGSKIDMRIAYRVVEGLLL